MLNPFPTLKKGLLPSLKFTLIWSVFVGTVVQLNWNDSSFIMEYADSNIGVFSTMDNALDALDEHQHAHAYEASEYVSITYRIERCGIDGSDAPSTVFREDVAMETFIQLAKSPVELMMETAVDEGSISFCGGGKASRFKPRGFSTNMARLH
jgi:hypothetical protein